MSKIYFNTFEDAAEFVAKDFIQTMKEENFDTFQEMKQCYMWDTDDVKSEVYYILQNTNCVMWDDGTTLELGDQDIEWRFFSKLFRSKINSLMES